MRSSSRRQFMIAFQSGANFIASTFALVVCSSRIKWENWVITMRLRKKELILGRRTKIHKTPKKELIFRSRAQIHNPRKKEMIFWSRAKIHKNPRKKELIFCSRAQIHKTPKKRVDFQSRTQFTRHPKAQSTSYWSLLQKYKTEKKLSSILQSWYFLQKWKIHSYHQCLYLATNRYTPCPAQTHNKF